MAACGHNHTLWESKMLKFGLNLNLKLKGRVCCFVFDRCEIVKESAQFRNNSKLHHNLSLGLSSHANVDIDDIEEFSPSHTQYTPQLAAYYCSILAA